MQNPGSLPLEFVIFTFFQCGKRKHNIHNLQLSYNLVSDSDSIHVVDTVKGVSRTSTCIQIENKPNI